MTQTKTNRIFLGIVTLFMALAGTGLTIANNGDFQNYDPQIWAIALTLAACFTTAETSFLWGHKMFEKVKGLARKIPLIVALVAIVVSMGFAVYEELALALRKLDNRSLAQNSATIVSSVDRRNQRSLGAKALAIISSDDVKIATNPNPFVACYIITGLASIVFLTIGYTRQVRNIKGNQLTNNPDLQAAVRNAGIDPATARAYAVNGGHSIYDKSGYKKFIPAQTKKKIGFTP